MKRVAYLIKIFVAIVIFVIAAFILVGMLAFGTGSDKSAANVMWGIFAGLVVVGVVLILWAKRGNAPAPPMVFNPADGLYPIIPMGLITHNEELCFLEMPVMTIKTKQLVVSGTLYVTNQRLVLVAQKGGFEKKLSALVNITTYKDALSFQFGNTTYYAYTAEPFYVYGLIQEVIATYNK